MPTAFRFLLPAALLGLFALLAGCGPSGPKTIPVSGKVTLDGEKVPGPGYIYFTTEGGEGLSRPGTAEFGADGSYRAKTFTPGDGLLPGKYLIRVDCYKTPPNMEGKPVVSFIPSRYQNASQSKLELTVKPNDRSVTFDIDLKSK